MTLYEYLSVPYVVAVIAVRGADGVWRRRAECPELPGCFAEGDSPEEALERLEEAVVSYLRDRMEREERIPVPRPPLRERVWRPALPT